MQDFCILCIDDFKILKIFDKLSEFSTIFYRETSQVPTPPPPPLTPQRPHDVSRGQNRFPKATAAKAVDSKSISQKVRNTLRKRKLTIRQVNFITNLSHLFHFFQYNISLYYI